MMVSLRNHTEGEATMALRSGHSARELNLDIATAPV